MAGQDACTARRMSWQGKHLPALAITRYLTGKGRERKFSKLPTRTQRGRRVMHHRQDMAQTDCGNWLPMREEAGTKCWHGAESQDAKKQEGMVAKPFKPSEIRDTNRLWSRWWRSQHDWLMAWPKSSLGYDDSYFDFCCWFLDCDSDQPASQEATWPSSFLVRRNAIERKGRLSTHRPCCVSLPSLPATKPLQKSPHKNTRDQGPGSHQAAKLTEVLRGWKA